MLILFLVKPCQKANGVCSDLIFFCKFNFFSNTVFIELSVMLTFILSRISCWDNKTAQIRFWAFVVANTTWVRGNTGTNEVISFHTCKISVFILNAAALWLFIDFCLLNMLLRIGFRAFVAHSGQAELHTSRIVDLYLQITLIDMFHVF